MRLINADALADRLTKMLEYVQQGDDLFYQGEMNALREALEAVNQAPTVYGLDSVKEQPDSKCVTLSDMLVVRARMFFSESDLFILKLHLEQQVKNGDRVLILPDYMEPVIVPKGTEIHIENPADGVLPPRIEPKRGY